MTIVNLPYHRHWIGRPLSELEAGIGVHTAFVVRFGKGLLPTMQTVVQEGDLIYASVLSKDVHDVADKAADLPGGRHLMRIAIAGAGSVGRSIAGELVENGHQVMLIDRDPEAIKPERIEAAEWVLADACEVALLEDAGLQTCDVVIACTGDDKVNLVVVAAGQDRVRGRPGRRPGERPAQRVAVHRRLGRRRRGVDAAHPGRPGRGGRHASATWSGCSPCARVRSTWSR